MGLYGHGIAYNNQYLQKSSPMAYYNPRRTFGPPTFVSFGMPSFGSIFSGFPGFGFSGTQVSESFNMPWSYSLGYMMNALSNAFCSGWNIFHGGNQTPQGAANKNDDLEAAAKKCKSYYGGDSTFKDYTFTTDGQHLYARNGNESYVADSFEEMNEKLTTVKEGNSIEKTNPPEQTVTPNPLKSLSTEQHDAIPESIREKGCTLNDNKDLVYAKNKDATDNIIFKWHSDNKKWIANDGSKGHENLIGMDAQQVASSETLGSDIDSFDAENNKLTTKDSKTYNWNETENKWDAETQA